MTTIAVVNQSTLVPQADAALMVAAVKTQLPLIAAAYRQTPAHIVLTSATGATAAEVPIFLLDDPDQAGALGYHDETPDGRQYGRIFARPVLDNGGDLLHLPLSVASVLSHEALEWAVDPRCNLWADVGGKMVALESCDPVEADSYAVAVPGSPQPVTVSNFVLPSWFDPYGKAPFDRLGKLTAPGTMTRGGYEIVMAEGRVKQVFGEVGPEQWRQGLKTAPASRTAQRGSFA